MNSIFSRIKAHIILWMIWTFLKYPINKNLAEISFSQNFSSLSFESIGKFYFDSLSNDSVKFYTVETDSFSTSTKLLRLQIFKGTKYNKEQIAISYDYCNSISDCNNRVYEKLENGNRIIKHDEITGQILLNDTIWMHPPRSEFFRILELNAFPYFIDHCNQWEYVLSFGDHWSDTRWKVWTGRKISRSIYSNVGDVKYLLNGKIIECYKVYACTELEDLGFSESIFYYSKIYGFVYMCFYTINGQTIEFKMI